jgi:hypothetical protein
VDTDEEVPVERRPDEIGRCPVEMVLVLTVTLALAALALVLFLGVFVEAVLDRIGPRTFALEERTGLR